MNDIGAAKSQTVNDANDILNSLKQLKDILEGNRISAEQIHSQLFGSIPTSEVSATDVSPGEGLLERIKMLVTASIEVANATSSQLQTTINRTSY